MDAAITMAGMLAVARPHMNGVGGDMFLLYHDASDGSVHALNASGRAGTAATLADLRARGLQSMPETGPLSVSVPGAVGDADNFRCEFGDRWLSSGRDEPRLIGCSGRGVCSSG